MSDQANNLSAGFRYRLLATELENQINTGLYKAGDRLPSLRTLQSRTGLSITTINQAYVEMEKRGLVEPREKSGFYVRPLLKSFPPPSKATSPTAGRPRPVTIGSQDEAILAILQNEDVTPFGAALPASQLLPAKQLAQSAQKISARYFRDPGSNAGPQAVFPS